MISQNESEIGRIQFLSYCLQLTILKLINMVNWFQIHGHLKGCKNNWKQTKKNYLLSWAISLNQYLGVYNIPLFYIVCNKKTNKQTSKNRKRKQKTNKQINKQTNQNLQIYIFLKALMFVCLFVCLFNRSLHVETHLGSDGIRLEYAEAGLKSLNRHAGQLVYGNVSERNRFEVKRWRKRRPLLNYCNFLFFFFFFMQFYIFPQISIENFVRP